eukprot:TRINITY_DN1386_c0_g1_i1.p1 TRINITY_DN1386_c0_g1~~TRINITY_DN1386_c0_g1_i1.p1  ORF type:complete len:975 (+),score=369.62 TRINITY_DN1386_c0_g1_i1:106-2925(+)
MCLGRVYCRRPYPIPYPHPHPHPVPHPPIIAPPKQEEKVLSSIPLVGAHIHSEISDLSAKVRVSQRFINNGKETLELTYEFPLPQDASVCSFSAEIEGKKIKSILKEKNKAREDFDDAIASGHGAYLAEKEENGNFKSSIGSLPPSKEVLLILEYVVSLHYDGHQIHLEVKGDDQVTSAKESNQNVKMENGGVEEGITVTSHITTSSPIVEVSSPTHQIDWKKGSNDREANVTFKNLSNSLNKDLCLSFQVSEPYAPTFNAEKDSEGNATVAVSFHPDLKTEESNDEVFTELIFLVDCSGSMSGSPIKAVNQTLQIFLRSLPETCLFNIIDFGSTSKSLFPNYESKKYSESTLDSAVADVEKKTASLGGTDLLPPLQKIFGKATVQGYSRQIFLLTDGQVSNSKECIQECAKNAHDTRVFTFGIGNDVDVNLVRNIAKESNGVCELLPYGSNFEEPVMRQLIRALKPSISNLSFNVEGLTANEVQTTPFHPPPIYAGDRVVFYINLDKPIASKHQKLETKLNGYIGTKAFTQSVQVDLSASKTVANKDDLLVAYLYGSSAIQDFEKKRSYLHTASGKLANGISQSQVDKKTLDTSLKTGILCKSTAFVAVEERDGVAVEGVPKQMELKTEESQESGKKKKQLQDNSFGGGLLSSIKNSSLKKSAPKMREKDTSASFGLADTLAMSMNSRRAAIPADLSDGSEDDEWEDEYSAAPMELEKKQVQMQRNEGGSDRARKSESALPPPPPSQSYSHAPPPAAPRVSAFGGPSPGSGGVSAFGNSSGGGGVSAFGSPKPIGGVSAFGRGGFGMSSSPVSVSTSTSTTTSSPKASGVIDPNLPIASRLVQCQNANGSFKDVALSILGISKDELKNNLPNGSGSEAEAIFLAALVCAYLESKCQKDQTSWTLVVKKARNWIKKESERLKVEASSWDQAAVNVVACL